MEATATKTIWSIDPTHSEIQFKVKHLVISTVTGYFGRFDGGLESAGDTFENAKISFSAQIDSLSTNNEQRDGHLKSPDFFDAAQFPELRFESTSFQPNGDNTYVLVGKMTIRDITREVVLAVEHGGTMQDPYGQTKAGFEINGKISRKEFGLSWNATTEAGGVVVGDDVKLHVNVQLVRQ